jgi:hypothetical protein
MRAEPLGGSQEQIELTAGRGNCFRSRVVGLGLLELGKPGLQGSPALASTTARRASAARTSAAP